MNKIYILATGPEDWRSFLAARIIGRPCTKVEIKDLAEAEVKKKSFSVLVIWR